MSYKLRNTRYNGNNTYIVCHGYTDPPPIIAICNYMLLSTSRSSSTFKPKGGHFSHKNGRALSQHDVTDMFRPLAISYISQGHVKGYVVADFPEDSFRAGPLLVGDTYINPNHIRGTTDFDFKDNLLNAICDFLSIPLHHGWIVDPEDAEICEAFGSISSSDKVTDHHENLANGFLNSTSQSQLTDYGVARLTESIEEGELAMLFRKKHLSLIRKYCGSLFILETNDDRWNNLEGVMWRTLNVVDDEEAFFTNEFSSLVLEKQPNQEVEQVKQFIEQWKQAKKKEADKYQEDLINEEKAKKSVVKTDSSKTSSGTKKKSKKKKNQNEEEKHGVEQQEKSDKESKAKLTQEFSGAETILVPPSGPTEDTSEDQWVSDAFMDFLEGFIDEDDVVPDGGDKVPFFVREVDNMKLLPRTRRPFKMQVMYPDIEKYNKKLAFAILNDRNRLNDVLTKTIVEFRLKHGCGKKEELKGKIRLIIREMPAAESTQSFSDFLKCIDLVEPHTLCDGTTVNSTSFIGRRVGTGYVNHILENHKEGRSWNGEWKISDMAVKNGRFVIMKAAMNPASVTSMIADFKNLIELLFKEYKSEEIPSVPAYFDEFQSDILRNMSKHNSDPRNFKKFQEYLSHHLAFKAPLVRSTLLGELYRVCQSLRKMDEDGNYKEGFPPLDMNDGLPRWTTKASMDWPFSKVYSYENCCPRDKYNGYTYWNLLQFLRHSDEHLPDHTRDNTGVQQIQDIIQVDLMIADEFDYLAARLILEMMYELTDAPFSSLWRHYETSECSDELKNTAAGRGEEADSWQDEACHGGSSC